MKKKKICRNADTKCVKKEYEAGKSVSDISRELSIYKQTFYRWLKKYQDMEKEDLTRLKELEQK